MRSASFVAGCVLAACGWWLAFPLVAMIPLVDFAAMLSTPIYAAAAFLMWFGRGSAVSLVFALLAAPLLILQAVFAILISTRVLADLVVFGDLRCALPFPFGGAVNSCLGISGPVLIATAIGLLALMFVRVRGDLWHRAS